MNLIQKKKEITERRKTASFWKKTKFIFRKRSRRIDSLKKIRLLSESSSDQEETSKRREQNKRRENSKKVVNKKFRVNNISCLQNCFKRIKRNLSFLT
jgi:hypothetical protein